MPQDLPRLLSRVAEQGNALKALKQAIAERKKQDAKAAVPEIQLADSGQQGADIAAGIVENG